MKILLMSMACITTLAGNAQEERPSTDSIVCQINGCVEQFMKPLAPTYMKNVTDAYGWDSNWFIEIKGGASAFLGTPIGCGDVFNRISPTLQVGIGKWFTPSVGGRIGYQGLQFKNAEFEKMNYHFVHADFMYNLTAFVGQNESGLARWDIIPFLGVGMIYNPDWPSCCVCATRTSGSHPFAFSYGLEARYRINDRINLLAEVSGMTTSRKFDGIGNSTRFGDNMVNLSAGLSFTLGKTRNRRVIDAEPYILQNEWLINHASKLDNANKELQKREKDNKLIIAEYHKILEIEGLLDKYEEKLHRKTCEMEKSLYPRNDYSGLNSLKKRLNNQGLESGGNGNYEI